MKVMDTMYGLEAFVDITAMLNRDTYADTPTIVMPALPRTAVPGVGARQWREILDELEKVRRQALPPVDPLPAAMQQLFMSTMNYFHTHSHQEMRPALVATLSALQRTSHDSDPERRRAITVVACDFIARSPAIADPAVRQALQAADAIVTPMYGEVAR